MVEVTYIPEMVGSFYLIKELAQNPKGTKLEILGFSGIYNARLILPIEIHESFFRLIGAI